MLNNGVSIRKHKVMKSFRQIPYHFQKLCNVKPIRYENCVELFVLDGNTRPIHNEKHKGLKRIRYNGNMVLKNKKRSGTSLPAPFPAWLLKKSFFHIIFY